MKTIKNQVQIDNPHNPDIVLSKWRVCKPEERLYRVWRLCLQAELKVGQIGIEVVSQIDGWGQTQRQLKFEDGSSFWFYPVWVAKVKLEEGVTDDKI